MPVEIIITSTNLIYHGMLININIVILTFGKTEALQKTTQQGIKSLAASEDNQLINALCHTFH